MWVPCSERCSPCGLRSAAGHAVRPDAPGPVSVNSVVPFEKLSGTPEMLRHPCARRAELTTFSQGCFALAADRHMSCLVSGSGCGVPKYLEFSDKSL